MKYLKLFEEQEPRYIVNIEDVTTISFPILRAMIEEYGQESFSDYEITELLYLFPNKRYQVQSPRRLVEDDKNDNKFEVDSRYASENISELTVYKLGDEWFVVLFKSSSTGGGWYYKCDQFDKVLELINFLK